MNISAKLINQYLKKPLKTQEMAEVLEKSEVEVEEIIYAAQLDEKIITASVKEVSKHPNADKLKLVTVSTDAGEIEVVCGAPNVRPGLVVALAQVGSVLPSGDVIEEATIRGEKSHGMLCSALELGWGDDHSGIVELDPTLPLGKSLCDIAENSDIIDIKTPSNRWDYLSYIGLTREIAANLADNDLVEPKLEEITYNDREVVKVKSTAECRAFVYAKLSIQTNSKSPQWLVDNLQASGMRSINPVVDITNFVMLETGQPSHAYDAKKIKGSLGVRNATPGEELTTLDGKLLKLSSKDVMIVDKSGPIGLAGVMGGLSTETTESTQQIILEVANFDKTSVRRSALRHGLRTEASSRFERGLPLPLPHYAANRIIGLLKEICGAQMVEQPNRQLYGAIDDEFLGMRQRKAEKFLGYKLDEKAVQQALSKRGFKPSHFSLSKQLRALPDRLEANGKSNFVEKIYSMAGVKLGQSLQDLLASGMDVPPNALKPGDLILLSATAGSLYDAFIVTAAGKAAGYIDQRKKVLSTASLVKSKNYVGSRRYVDNFNHIISVEVPWWRLDITSEVDLFEEVAKAMGYENMPATLPLMEPTNTESHQLLPHLLNLKNALVSYGMVEVMTHSFVSKKDIITSLSNLEKNLQVENPLSSEQDYLRSNLLPSHLRAVAKNLSTDNSAIFELSRVYEKSAKAAHESWRLAITVWGAQSLLRLKGVIDVVFDYYKLGPSYKRELNSEWFYSGRSARIGSGFGYFGQLNDSILRDFDISKEVSYAELNIEEIIESRVRPKITEVLPYQIIKRDITVETNSLATFEELKNSLEKTCKSTNYVGEYVDDSLKSQSRKRISISVDFDLGPNPTAQQIDDQLKECVVNLEKLPQAKVL